MRPTKKPFKDALTDAMATRDISFARLAAATKTVDPKGKGLSSGYIHNLASGLKRPTTRNLELLAAALRTDPRYWSEYREHLASQRAGLLATEIGLEAVLAALDALEAEKSSDDTGAND